MAVKDVESKCWILALFVRDDGERFLLGDGKYEFTEDQMHFAANVMANDVVEVQGNDGYMLAGQVRRPDTQSFDGYIGDSSTSKTEVEACRQAFFKFFRKNFFYKVIYIFSDGSAIQRKRGFLVDAPEAKELYQIYPKYHVALNFEDINYYYYDENADGDEIYGKSATISLNSAAQTGGLVWIEPGTTTISEEGTSFTINNTIAGGGLSNVEVKGDTFQQTYSGKNLLKPYNATQQGITTIVNPDGSVSCSGTTTSSWGFNLWANAPVAALPAGTYTFSINKTLDYELRLIMRDAVNNSTADCRILPGNTSATVTTTRETTAFYPYIPLETTGVAVNIQNLFLQMEASSTSTAIEPYVGGTASPNPDYPQEVQTVTGEQTVEIRGSKNLFNFNQFYNNRASFSVNNGNINIGENYIEYSNPTTADQYYNAHVAANKSIYGMNNLRPNTTYTVSYAATSATSCYIFFWDNSDTRTLVSQNISAGGGSFTFKTPSDLSWYSVRIDNTSSSANTISNLQLESGSSASSYEPYIDQTYTVDLGDIELCKIGTYQDRIYKENGSWWLRKEVEKVVLDGSETWASTWVGDGGKYIYYCSNVLSNSKRQAGFSSDVICKSDYYIATSYNGGPGSIWADRANDTRPYLISILDNSSLGSTGRIFVKNSSIATADAFKAWLASNPTSLYYQLATPTTTQITDTTLINQLEALANATTYAGQTTFTVDGNGNLAATLAVELEITGGGGVLWEDNGAVWEEGKPAYSTITIDSIDNVYPMVTITGRTVNPIITDVTTGMAFQYSGTITESQTLTIDMLNKTATLNGTSVIGNVTGDWIYLTPGANRITYTADNATAPNATIEWQEIVG